MADVSGQAILNEAALKRLDPYVKKVIDTAKFVALYTFKLKENKWEKTGVEGSLFVYSRTGEPFYNILVLNRLNTTNLIEPISSKLTLQLHEPFLLYLNAQYCLHGMWFYEKEECIRLAALIEKLMKESSERERSPSTIKNPNGANVDIYNMLSRAQEACNNSKVKGSLGNDSKRLNSQEADQQTPQSVMEFFAKAGSAPKKTSLPPHNPGLGLPRCQTEEESESTSTNPLIHQLMSNPVHLVEHIEKQQRLVTPQNNEIPSDKVLKLLIRQAGQSLVTPEHQDFMKDRSNSLKLDNGLNNYNSPLQVSPSPLLPLQSHQEGKNNLMLFSTPNGRTDSPRKPALMPPAMFTPQNSKDLTDSVSVDDFKLEPLTRNQLFQAINYLLKNDPVFMTKIHEAYVKSLTDKVL